MTSIGNAWPIITSKTYSRRQLCAAGLDSIRFVGEDADLGLENPEEAEPLIQLAHRKWQQGGEARTLYSARSLGGQCWLDMSERWYDMYGFHYDPERHPPESFQKLHAEVTSERIKAMMSVQDVEMGGAEDLKASLVWREKNAFMSRKTDFGTTVDHF
jgi:hypothetical protein